MVPSTALTSQCWPGNLLTLPRMPTFSLGLWTKPSVSFRMLKTFWVFQSDRLQILTIALDVSNHTPLFPGKLALHLKPHALCRMPRRNASANTLFWKTIFPSKLMSSHTFKSHGDYGWGVCWACSELLTCIISWNSPRCSISHGVLVSPLETDVTRAGRD